MRRRRRVENGPMASSDQPAALSMRPAHSAESRGKGGTPTTTTLYSFPFISFSFLFFSFLARSSVNSTEAVAWPLSLLPRSFCVVCVMYEREKEEEEERKKKSILSIRLYRHWLLYNSSWGFDLMTSLSQCLLLLLLLSSFFFFLLFESCCCCCLSGNLKYISLRIY